MNELKLPDFFFNFNNNSGKEKINIGPIENGKHLTFHFGTKSKIFDVHIKDERNNSYETIIAIRYFSLYRLLVLTKPDIDLSISRAYSNYINLGKLRKYDCFFQPLVSNENNLKLFKTNKNKTRFNGIKTISSTDLANYFVNVDGIDICHIPYYTVYRIHKGLLVLNGFIFRKFENITKSSFIYLSKKQNNILRNELLKILIDNIEKINDLNCKKLLQLLRKHN